MTGKMEPTADLRQMANVLRQMYVALTDEGFSSTEALTIVGQILYSQTKPKE